MVSLLIPQKLAEIAGLLRHHLIKRKVGSVVFARRSDLPFLFPLCSRYAPPPPVLKVGDRVRIRGRERLGVGTVISFDADYRLVRLSFSGMDGWWARMDLMKEEPNSEY